MVVLTDSAAKKIQGILASEGKDGYGLRIYVEGGGCSGFQYGMALENTAQEGDAVEEINGIRVYVDPSSAQYLGGAHIDYVEELTGSGFRISNPNATSTCGCGHSFSAE